MGASVIYITAVEENGVRVSRDVSGEGCDGSSVVVQGRVW